VEVDMTLRVFVGGVAFAAGTALSVGLATAADLPVPQAPAPVVPVAYAPAAIYNWTGFYIGGHVGGGFGNSSWSDPFTGANNTFKSGTGFLGGAQVGGNLQFNMLVLGVEGDFSYSGLKGSGTDSIGDTINTNTNWTSTVTGRVGAEVDVESARELARQIALDLVASAAEAAGGPDGLAGVVKLVGLVRSAPGFDQQPAVLNGASDQLVEIFGEAGRHARTAVGVGELPMGAALEIEAVFALA
jgi:enamine deaminase RidA (YjgF/YER057c/UK114 family)